MIPRATLAIVAATTLLVALTACGMPAPVETPVGEPIGDPTPVATDGSSPALASGERPDPAADVVCNDLTNPAQLDPVFSVAVDLAPPSRTAEYIGARIADEWVVRQAGGVACQWSDPAGITTSEGRYLSGLDLRLLPASGPQWQQFSDAQGDGSDRRSVCEDWGQCDYDRFFGGTGGSAGWWLSLSAFNIDGLPSPTVAQLQTLTAPVFSAIATTVQGLPAPDPAWTAPTPDIAFGGGCDGVITGARMASALGIGAAVDSEAFEYPRVSTAAMQSIGGSECHWVRASDGADIGYIQVLPGGAWAQGAARSAMMSLGATVPSPAVAGVPVGATALYEHVDSLSLDIVLGGSWIKISMGNGPVLGGLSQQDALVAIATDIAAHA